MQAAYLVVDNRTAALNEAGDLLIPHREGAIPDAAAHIKWELGQLIVNPRSESEWADAPFTAFKSLGLAVEDLAAAEYLCSKAEKAGKGILLHL